MPVKFFLLVFLLPSSTLKAQNVFQKYIYVKNKVSMPYQLLTPLNYDSTKSYPLIIFYHGAGERGTDNDKPARTSISHGVLNLEFQKKYPCFILAPQCNTGHRWVEVDWALDKHTLPSAPSIYLKTSLNLLDSLVKVYPIDTTRIYVTGLSMGGFATWDVISRYPQKFAAALPICGGGDEKQAAKFRHVPIWAFHGALDTTVKPSRSKNMVEALKKLGANPQYTIYPDLGHPVWKQTYTNPAVWQWLFAQVKK